MGAGAPEFTVPIRVVTMTRLESPLEFSDASL